MKQRFKQMISLFFAFIFSLIPLLIFQYNQFQRRLTERGRKIARWDRTVISAHQLFNSMGSFDKQILNKFSLLKNDLDSLNLAKKITPEQFRKLLSNNLNGSYAPTALFACETTSKKRKPTYFSGNGYTKANRVLFKEVLEKLASDKTISGNVLKRLNDRLMGLIAPVDFEALKEARGLIYAVPYDNTASLIYWNKFDLPFDQKITFICIFKDLHKDEKIVMSAFNSFKRQYEGISFAMVPVQNVFGKHKLHFYNASEKSKRLVRQCYNEMCADAKNGKSRNLKCFPGEFANYNGLRFSRNYIDFNYSYELWLFNELEQIAALKDSGLEIILRSLFFTFWVIIFSRVLITGAAIRISLKSRLTLTFAVVGLLPLLMCLQAALTQIDSASYRREEKLITDVSKHLEEADASSKSTLNEFRSLCHEADCSTSLVPAMLSSDTQRLEAAVEKIYRRFKKFGFPIESCYVFPSDKAVDAGFKSGIFQFNEGDNVELIPKGSRIASFSTEVLRDDRFLSTDTGLFDLYKQWIENAYFQKAKETSHLKRESTSIAVISGKSVEQLMRQFVAKRGMFHLVDYVRHKQYFHHNFFLSNSLPKNWYILRVSADKIVENSLIHAVKKLEKLYPADSFGILHNRADNQSFEFIYPNKKNINSYTRVQLNLLQKSFQASEGGVINLKAERLAVIWPCVKADNCFLYGIVNLRDLRRHKMTLEIILSILFALMCIPVFGLSRFASGYLIDPLKRVETGLKRITAGDYKQLINLNRSDELGKLASAFDKMTVGIAERKNLGLFVSGTLDKEVGTKITTDFSKLQRYVGAALVSDIRSFTGLSEAWPVRDVVSMLNAHLKAMSECVKRHNGMVEQFVGDEIIAVFYADSEKEAVKVALNAAVDMMANHRAINLNRKTSGLFTYNIGIGIEPGVFLAGTISSQSQKTYVLFGEARGRAEELEADSKKAVGSKIIVSEKGFKLVNELFKFAAVEGTNSYELLSEHTS